MTVVRCPYCELSVVEIAVPAAPLPRLKDGLIGPDGRLFGVRGSGDLSCVGYDLAVRIYWHAGEES